MRWVSVLSALMLVMAIGCGGDDGDGGVGSGCSLPGSLSECSAGNICSNLSGDGNQCRQICTVQADCALDQNCNGIANTTIKSCQPK